MKNEIKKKKKEMKNINETISGNFICLFIAADHKLFVK